VVSWEICSLHLLCGLVAQVASASAMTARRQTVRMPPVRLARLIIFDCDGVLVDSEVISNDVLAQALSAEGLPTTLSEARSAYQGLLLAEVVRQAERRLGRPLPEDWLARYERDRAAVFRRDLRAVPDAAETVAAFSAAGVEVCVASQGKLEKTRLSLELTGLRQLFAERALFSAEQVARGKPHPDLFLHAASTMGVSPSECVVVEDSPSGVSAASAAAMRVFGYAADSDPEALRRAGAELIGSLAELPRLLGLALPSPQAGA
jgi:HAD superfamily hydrolase (TIGR01509 family)